MLNDAPTWKHTKDDKWIVVGNDGVWWLQTEGSEGKAFGWLQLIDPLVASPDLSKETWKEGDGNSVVGTM